MSAYSDTTAKKIALVTDATGALGQSIDRQFLLQAVLNLASDVLFSITGVELPIDGGPTL